MCVFLYVGGGTAGHIFPGQAIAERSSLCKNVFLTDARGAQFVNKSIFHEVIIIDTNRRKIFRFMWQIVAKMHQLRKKEKISGVFLLGGLITFLPGIFAYLYRIPCCVIETNAIMGKANRWLSKIIKKIYTTFDLSKQNKHALRLGFFVRKEFVISEFEDDSKKKLVDISNNQIMLSVLENQDLMEDNAEQLKAQEAKTEKEKNIMLIDDNCIDLEYNILIMGSSIGAKYFAQHLPSAIRIIKEKLTTQRNIFNQSNMKKSVLVNDQAVDIRLKIIQHAPKNTHETLQGIYKEMDVAAELYDFIEDIPTAMRKANLIICRAGASSISEGYMMRKTMILVPYKHAADDHQTYNAMEMQKLGYAFILKEEDFDAIKCAEIIFQGMIKSLKMNDNSIKQNTQQVYELNIVKHDQSKNDAAKLIWKYFPNK